MNDDRLVSFYNDPETGRPLAYMLDPLRRVPTTGFKTTALSPEIAIFGDSRTRQCHTNVFPAVANVRACIRVRRIGVRKL